MFTLTRRAASKLLELARRDDATSPPLTPRTTGGAAPRGAGLWVEITATGTGADAGLHSIKRLQKMADARFEDHVSGFTAEFAARANDGTVAPVGSIVRVEFAGYKDGTPDPLYLFDRSPATMLVKLTADGASDGFYQAVEVAGTGSTFSQVTGGATFNGTDYPEVYETTGATGIYRSGTDTVVEVTLTANDDGTINAYFTHHPATALGKVLSVDRPSHRITAQDVNPDGSAIANPRSFGSIRVTSAKLPAVGEFVRLDSLAIGGTTEWFTTNDQGDNVLARVTGGATGNVNWVEVSVDTHADLLDGRSGSARLPNGWQSMPTDTIVEVMPGPSASYTVAGVVRGIKPDASTSTDQTPEVGSNSGIGIAVESWLLDDQPGTGGLRSVQVGEAFIEGSAQSPEALWMDRYSAQLTSEGHLAERTYLGSVGIGTDNADDGTNQVSGHISLKQVGDESGNPIVQPVLVVPQETFHTRTIDIVAGNNMTGGGQITLTFDETGRYNGGNVTETITLDADTQGGGGGGEPATPTSITGEAPISANGTPGGTYTISLDPPGETQSTVTLEGQPSSPDDLITIGQNFSLTFDSDGRYNGGSKTEKPFLFYTFNEDTFVTGVTFDETNGLQVTTKTIKGVYSIVDTNTTTVASATSCS
ncbi:MAG: hypothetical protein AAGJ38_05055 [Planctomycetota bacterium]